MKIRSLEVSKDEISRVGGPRPGLLVPALLAGLMASVAYALVAATNSVHDYLWDYVWRVPPIIATSFAMLLLGTSRIEAGEDYLYVRNLVTQWTIGRGAISDVSDHNGVMVETVNGKKIYSFAFGSSTLQTMSVSASYSSACTRIRQWKRYREDSPGPEAVLLGVRQDAARLLVIALAYSVVLVIVTWQCGPWIRKIVAQFL